MKKPTVNFGHSARVRLLAVANERGVQLEYVLLRYAFERFLYRLGVSAYSNRLVLKGASAFAVWIGPFVRVTRDADLEAFGEVSPESLLAMFKEICAISYPEDGVEFDLSSFVTEAIRKEDKYPGVRVMFLARIGGARVNLQCDVGSGDSVYPSAEIAEYPALLKGAAPQVRIYPRYTVVAEKFQVMVVRGLLNSRLKDYHDLWLLSKNFDFDRLMLRTAIERTFARRETSVPLELPEALSALFYGNMMKQSQWRAFLNRAGIEFTELQVVVRWLAEFLSGILKEDFGDAVWCHNPGKWEKA